MLRHCSTTTATENYITICTTNTGNNVASLQYNNSNGQIVPCQQDAARMLKQEKKDTKINNQPFNGINFIFLQFKEQLALLILQLGK